MKFGAVPVGEAEGGIAVHSIRKDGLVLKKGTLDRRSRGRCAAGRRDSRHRRGAARAWAMFRKTSLPPRSLRRWQARALRVDRAFTGRANLFAETAGVLVVDKPAIDRLNLIDEAVTFATLPAYKPVVAGEMIATVKIIPFAVTGAVRDAAVSVTRDAPPLIRVAPYRIRKVGVVSTLLPGLAGKVIEKTLRVTAERLAPAGAVSSPSGACRMNRAR